jgi:hypothetical protein
MEALSDRVAGVRSVMADLGTKFSKAQVKGLVAELVTVPAEHRAATDALEIAAGGRLYSVRSRTRMCSGPPCAESVLARTDAPTLTLSVVGSGGGQGRDGWVERPAVVTETPRAHHPAHQDPARQSARRRTCPVRARSLSVCVSVVLLNSHAPCAHDARVQRVNEVRALAPGRVDVALSLVGFPAEVEAAMDFVFGATMICKGLWAPQPTAALTVTQSMWCIYR